MGAVYDQLTIIEGAPHLGSNKGRSSRIDYSSQMIKQFRSFKAICTPQCNVTGRRGVLI